MSGTSFAPSRFHYQPPYLTKVLLLARKESEPLNLDHRWLLWPAICSTSLPLPRSAQHENIAGEGTSTRCAIVGVIEVVTSALATEGFQAVQGATFLDKGRLDSFSRPLQSALRYILAYGSLGYTTSSDVTNCWRNLVEICQAKDAEDLVSCYAKLFIETSCKVSIRLIHTC